MRIALTVLLSVLLLGLPAATEASTPIPQALQLYEAQELPTLPGFPYPRVRAINDSGHVAGTNYTCPFILSCFSRSFLFDGAHIQDISLEIINAVPAPFVGLPVTMDLNNADQVLIRLAVPDVGLYHFLWDDGEPVLINADPDADPNEPGPLVPIPPPPGTAWAVNDNGTVAGTVGLGSPANPVNHAFLWERDLGVVELISPPPGFSGIGARGLNNQNHVVGGMSGAVQRAFIWVEGVITTLDPLPGDAFSTAVAVNEDGFVVGTSRRADFLESLVIWHDGEIVDFVTLEVEPSLLQFPERINGSREVVGYYWPTAESPQHFGFRWTEQDGFVQLNGTIQNIPELNVWAAEGLNESGQIAAWAEYPDFTGGGFILTPVSEVPGDLNDDGIVNAADLALLLGSWGPCADCPADLNQDGTVDAADLALLLGNWG